MTYPKAPIHEAIFDIKVSGVENTDIKSYQELSHNALSEFPNTDKRIQLSGRFKVDQEKQDVVNESKKKNILGVIYSNPNENIKVQFRKDGYTLNMLKPYSNWNEFSSIAFKYWQVYKREIKPTEINRIALRYINKIVLPLKGLDFNTYFRNMPEMPTVLKQAYSDFFLRIESQCKDSNNNAIIIRTFNKPNNKELPFILDIDVYRREDISEGNIKGHFELLRKNKNDIFESLITDKTRKLFK